ncbi:MAG: GAF domain-containing SpoIIE family protein phosphatase [Kibdelosporangium sp.]
MAESRDIEDRLRRLEAVTDSALSHLDQEKLLQELLERVRELLGVDTATVLLYEKSAGQLAATAAAGLEEEVRQGVRIGFGEGFAGQVAAQRKPIVLDHVDATTVVNPLLWEKQLRALLGVPLLAGGQLLGVLHVGSVPARRFSDDDIHLLQLVADRMALATQAHMSTTERAATAALQRSLLPALPPSLPGLEFAARYVPGAALTVGGDWYDVFPLPEGQWGIVMGDVVGHGLPAAVIMGRLRSALRSYALLDTDPAVVLDRLDRKVTHFEPGAMATVLYAVINPSRQSLRISLAGHPPPVVATRDQPTRLLTLPANPPIGSGYARPHPSSHVEIPPDSVICFYTDGLVERRDRGIDDGLTLLCQAVEAQPAEAVCASVMAALIGDEATSDDVALLVLRHPAEHG